MSTESYIRACERLDDQFAAVMTHLVHCIEDSFVVKLVPELDHVQTAVKAYHAKLTKKYRAATNN